MKKLLFVLIFALLSSLSIFCQTCKGLPDKFTSNSNAIKLIKKSEFKFTDELPRNKSSWITSAIFYTCDGYKGYIVYVTNKGREYVHEKVPLQVWNDFKNASSSGSYYVSKIKGKYRLIL